MTPCRYAVDAGTHRRVSEATIRPSPEAGRQDRPIAEAGGVSEEQLLADARRGDEGAL